MLLWRKKTEESLKPINRVKSGRKWILCISYFIPALFEIMYGELSMCWYLCNASNQQIHVNTNIHWNTKSDQFSRTTDTNNGLPAVKWRASLSVCSECFWISILASSTLPCYGRKLNIIHLLLIFQYRINSIVAWYIECNIQCQDHSDNFTRQIR